jgi:hypothetical protein
VSLTALLAVGLLALVSVSWLLWWRTTPYGSHIAISLYVKDALTRSYNSPVDSGIIATLLWQIYARQALKSLQS